MGCYDELSGFCPNCGKEFICQTKIFDCTLKTIKSGDNVSSNQDRSNESLKLRVKYPCECDFYPVATINNGVFEGFLKCQADYIEGAFGHVMEAANRDI